MQKTVNNILEIRIKGRKARPVRLTWRLLSETLQSVMQKVSREFLKGITGSTEEHKIVFSYPEVSMEVL